MAQDQPYRELSSTVMRPRFAALRLRAEEHAALLHSQAERRRLVCEEAARRRARRQAQDQYLYTIAYWQHDRKSRQLQRHRQQRFERALPWNYLNLGKEDTDERRANRLDALLYAAGKRVMLSEVQREELPVFASTNYYHFMEIDLLASAYFDDEASDRDTASTV